MTSTLELVIDDLGAQGDGIAHYEGRAIFVAGTLPGERVLIKRSENAKDQQRGELIKILSTSPDRASPPCSHFPQCGGCRLQHLNTEPYTAWKTQQLAQILAHEALNHAPLQSTIVTAPATRRRARLAAKHTKEGLILGFNEWRGHTLVNIQSCAVLLPQLQNFIQNLRTKLFQWLPINSECDVQITALADGIDVVLIGGPALGLDQRQDLAIIAEELNIAKLSWRKWDRSAVEPVAHRSPLSMTYNNSTVAFPPGSFLQATATGEKALIDFTIKAAGSSAKVLDLFCGLGGFGLSLPHAKQVHFADLDGPAIDALGQIVRQTPRFQIEQRHLINNAYTTHECNAFDCVIFDPPRGGAKAQAIQLAQSHVPVIVAISCDPPNFARDAKILIDGGYRLQSLQPVDQFLWSTHLELAAHFTR